MWALFAMMMISSVGLYTSRWRHNSSRHVQWIEKLELQKSCLWSKTRNTMSLFCCLPLISMWCYCCCSEGGFRLLDVLHVRILWSFMLWLITSNAYNFYSRLYSFFVDCICRLLNKLSFINRRVRAAFTFVMLAINLHYDGCINGRDCSCCVGDVKTLPWGLC